MSDQGALVEPEREHSAPRRVRVDAIEFAWRAVNGDRPFPEVLRPAILLAPDSLPRPRRRGPNIYLAGSKGRNPGTPVAHLPPQTSTK